MRQLMFIEPGVLEWQEALEPKLEGPGEAVVRPLAVSNCDADQMILRGETFFRGPFPIGHEFVAEVVDVGDEVASVTPGDRVVVPFQISCGTCARCRKGLTAGCLTAGGRGMYGFGAVGGDWGGAMSDSVRVPFADHMLVPVPAGVPSDAIPAASDNLCDAWRTIAPRLAERPGAPMLLIGQSPSPAYAIEIALALGAESVDYADTDSARLELARSLGANPIQIGEWPRGLGQYPVTANGSPKREALHCAIRSTEPGGVCTNVFPFYTEPEPQIPLFEMFVNGITFLTSRPHVRPIIPEVLDLVRAQRIHPERVTGSVVSWDEAMEALLGPTQKLVMIPT